jgi:lipopolysaccharide/colanic/teichoic acid biosynthesis glycosyltransferase
VIRRSKLPAAEAGVATPSEKRAINASQLQPASARDRSVASLADRYARPAARQYEDRRLDLVLRGLDLAIATVALLVLLPVIALACLAILLTSGLPILYRGRRVGRGGRVYTMFKFRTLTPDAETRLGPYLGSELLRLTDSEVTTVGRWLRASHVDELPQLWNVVRGEMSIVGPRPIRPAFFEELCVAIPNYWQRLVIRPGLTGLAQLRMTRTTSWAEKLAHDLEYIADRSVSLYLRVVARTAGRLAALPFRALLRRARDS